MPRRRSQFFLKKVFPIAGFLLMFYTLFSLSKVIWKNYQIEKELKDLKETVSVLEEENQHFSNLISYFKTDAYREKEARQKLGYKKPGESVVLVPNVEEPSSVSVYQEENTKPKSTSRSWWDFFFKRTD